ncbi:hypothetical protein BDW02DRAFT_577274 [Decorospora gaudefroyi]|uniref:Uncharacterized protein n=1 Tax=Decorospora gaudefroyi TaxID=184978 RepID=A0A6A5KNQ0_9PLEO|nr:hypothetical protein BDW02DRAFT_577274 [Decorospora gaudefroyi]
MPLSSSIIALIAVGGVAGLIALVVLTAVIIDLSRRIRGKKDDSSIAEEKKSLDINEVEKEHTIYTTGVAIVPVRTSFDSSRTSRDIDILAAGIKRRINASLLADTTMIFSTISSECLRHTYGLS